MVKFPNTNHFLRPSFFFHNGTMMSSSTDASSPEDQQAQEQQQLSLDELRRIGNSNFSDGEFDTALHFYNLAVAEAEAATTTTDELLPLHLCNRSACLYQMERYEEALEDAKQAVDIGNNRQHSSSSSSYIKAYFRLGKTQLALKAYSDCMETCNTALEISRTVPL
jgi:tetratricopeptide (TPR) repeat protein